MRALKRPKNPYPLALSQLPAGEVWTVPFLLRTGFPVPALRFSPGESAESTSGAQSPAVDLAGIGRRDVVGAIAATWRGGAGLRNRRDFRPQRFQQQHLVGADVVTLRGGQAAGWLNQQATSGRYARHKAGFP